MRSGVNIPCERPLCFPLVSSSSSSSYSSPWTALLVDVPEWLIFTQLQLQYGRISQSSSIGWLKSALRSNSNLVKYSRERNKVAKEKRSCPLGELSEWEIDRGCCFSLWKCLEFCCSCSTAEKSKGSKTVWMIITHHPINISWRKGWMLGRKDEKKPGETTNKLTEGKRTSWFKMCCLEYRFDGIDSGRYKMRAGDRDRSHKGRLSSASKVILISISSIIYWFIVYMNISIVIIRTIWIRIIIVQIYFHSIKERDI